jgi:hypothetical protein
MQAIAIAGPWARQFTGLVRETSEHPVRPDSGDRFVSLGTSSFVDAE